ncbi:hypothetical protein [Klebsiella pneumoniae IS22]|nr:hypothetical protein [Klebsiella pneumoniae IS22]
MDNFYRPAKTRLFNSTLAKYSHKYGWRKNNELSALQQMANYK